MTRPLLLGIFIALAPGGAAAQGVPDSAILGTVTRLFDAMRARDTVALRAVFDTGARLVSAGKTREGAPVKSADQNLSAFCCSSVCHHRQPCRNRNCCCRFRLLPTGSSASMIVCLTEPKEPSA